MSLAFKQVKDEEKLERTKAQIFQMLSNKIPVLGHPPIQEHTTIAKLQGICWDISSDGKVWQVLVFEKSQFDGLYSFATRPIAKELEIHHRPKLCVDIGEPIIYMHSHRALSIHPHSARSRTWAFSMLIRARWLSIHPHYLKVGRSLKSSEHGGGDG